MKNGGKTAKAAKNDEKWQKTLEKRRNGKKRRKTAKIILGAASKFFLALLAALLQMILQKAYLPGHSHIGRCEVGGGLVHPLAHFPQYVPLPVVCRPLHLEAINHSN